MKVTRENSSPTEITLAVELAPEDENPFIERSYRRAVSRVNIPGFRRGRAPRHIVESMVGRATLVQEALEFMVPETLDKILQDEEVSAFAEPSIEVTDLAPVSFKATVPLEPTVDLGDYRSIRVESDPVGIADEEIDRVLERVREEHSVWEPVERPAQFGDRLNIDVHGLMDGETVLEDRDVEYVPHEDNVLPFPGFAPNLVGAGEDEELQFSVAVSDDYPRTQYAGKEIEFKVTVLSVKEKNLPELDDEFAKSVGQGFDDLAALRANIQESMTGQASAAARGELEQKSLDALCEAAVVNASAILYERELEAMQAERERMLQQQGLDMASYLRFVGKSAAEFRDEMRPSAERRLLGVLVMRKLAEVEQIEISDEDVAAEAERLLGMSESNEDGSEAENMDSLREFLNSESTRDNIRASLHNRRLMERLTDITQGKSEEAEPGAGSPVAADNAGDDDGVVSPAADAAVDDDAVSPIADVAVDDDAVSPVVDVAASDDDAVDPVADVAASDDDAVSPVAADDDAVSPVAADDVGDDDAVSPAIAADAASDDDAASPVVDGDAAEPVAAEGRE